MIKRKSKIRSEIMTKILNALRIGYNVERMGFYETNLRDCTQC